MTKQTQKAGINFDAHYQIDGWRGIAFYLMGYAQRQEPIMCYSLDDDGQEIEIESGEFEAVDDVDNVIAVMVGDNRQHTVSVDDIHEIDEEAFCRECGQIGCRCSVYS